MTLRTRIFLALAVGLGASWPALMAWGQAYSASTDPLVQRSVNMGEQMRAPTAGESNRELTTLDPRWSSFVFRSRVAPYPALPPVLGDDAWSGSLVGGATRPPASEFIGEIFYPGYATLLANDRLPVGEANRVKAYRLARQELIQQIRTACDQLSDRPTSDRTSTFAALWVRQEAALQALTAEAESLRHDLAWVDSFYGASGILGDLNRLDPASRDYFRLYQAAYNFAGLSPEQRRLLPEMAHDTRGAAGGPAGPTEGQDDRVLAFLPATARVTLPANLPPALAEKIRAFAAEKSRLKSELREAVLSEDYFWVRSRTQRLETLARTQAPRFAALEVLAEEIRVALAEFEPAAPPTASALPADLTLRVGTFYARKVAVQREVLTRLRALRAEEPNAKYDLVRQGDGLAITQGNGSGKARKGLSDFNASLARRYAEFAAESAVLRRDIQHFTETRPGREERTVDQLAADFAKAYATQENWNRYRNYRRAVLEPGLSPVQRQVLFQGAVAELYPNP